MASDTITLEVQGTVSLRQFAAAVQRFYGLVAALAAESKAQGARWEVDALNAGSATATVRGVAGNGTGPEDIERVVHSYLEVGQALESGTTIPYSPRVRKEAEGLAALIHDGVEGVRFDTADGEAIIRETPALPTAPVARREQSYGAVTGRVQTLTSRSQLRFTLYDRLYERAVSCYVVEGRRDLMREIWDKLATVEGLVTRDPASGRPLAVRDIRNVTILAENGPQAYMAARGVIPLRSGDLTPEGAIRRIRDGG